jgi:hypothetical protein
LGCPQLRHVTGNAAPHELQNFAVSGLSASQFEHRMAPGSRGVYPLQRE